MDLFAHCRLNLILSTSPSRLRFTAGERACYYFFHIVLIGNFQRWIPATHLHLCKGQFFAHGHILYFKMVDPEVAFQPPTCTSAKASSSPTEKPKEAGDSRYSSQPSDVASSCVTTCQRNNSYMTRTQQTRERLEAAAVCDSRYSSQPSEVASSCVTTCYMTVA